MDDKGELSINLIIVVAIGIVILLIVVFLIARTTGNYNDAALCNEKGGICKTFDSEGRPVKDDNGQQIQCSGGEYCYYLI